MNKLLKVTLLLAIAVGAFGAYRHVAAQEEAPDVVATKHVLTGTYINNSTGTACCTPNVPAGVFTPLDAALTVECPGSSGTCTIEADMWAQTDSSEGNTVCLYVDGVQSSGCPFQTSRGVSDPEAISSSWPVSGLAHGTHTVQTYVYSAGGEFVGNYTINYKVYKP